jgi:purine-nucleoside phosphorylase
MNEKQLLKEAQRLDQIGIDMEAETSDEFRIAEIRNCRAMLICILSGILQDGDDKIITEVSRRLIYLQKHPQSSGCHSMHPNPINQGVIRKR